VNAVAFGIFLELARRAKREAAPLTAVRRETNATMLRIATILHPTDFSPLSEHAFHLACSLARDHGGRVIVLHVAELPLVAPDGGMSPPPPGGVWGAITDRLVRVQPPEPNVLVQHRLEEGTSADTILRMAREVNCDLIVMGTHGRTGLAHLLMGSVAEQVVRKATCAVLVVKTPFPESSSD
jgi:nucleotide-binding universal stress UspA family protein